MNTNEAILAGFADPDASDPDADPGATLIKADTDAYLRIGIMSLCCTSVKYVNYLSSFFKGERGTRASNAPPPLASNVRPYVQIVL